MIARQARLGGFSTEVRTEKVRLALPPLARRGKIMAWIQEEGSARVRDLSDAFGVSEATVRQDLERLESEGQIIREHGGAYLKTLSQQVGSMALQQIANKDPKRRIGRLAASMVSSHESIIIDSGSTATEMVPHLVDKQGLNVITSGLNIALALGSVPSFSVHLCGGLFKPPTLSLSGEKSADYFKSVYAEKVFLAAAGVSLDAGLTYPSLTDGLLKRAMIASARKVYLMADSSKIGRNSFSSLGPISLIDALITDSAISPEDQEAFEKANIEVLIA